MSLVDEESRYRAYVMDVSYFSGKLEAYLRYKRIPYERVETGTREMRRDLLPNTGLMKVPTVRTPAGEWLQDSTPMIDWFEERHPEGRVIPADPYQAYLCRLLEDYADEWLWRPALHYRWSYGPDARLVGDRIAVEVMKDVSLPRFLKAWMMRNRQYRIYVAGDGVSGETRADVERVYTDTLARLERILVAHPFLLGGRPSLADFGFFASMFRHFSLDPTPARLMRDRAPAVYAWVARLWNARRDVDDGAWVAEGTVPAGWNEIIADAGSSYLPYLHANALAWRGGRRRFDFGGRAVTYRNLPVVHYRVWCRERLQDHFDLLPAEPRAAVRSTLEAAGAWEPLWRDGRIASRLHAGAAPPVCRPPTLGWRDRARAIVRGTTWARASSAGSRPDERAPAGRVGG
jgi:glutathione S-transferase